MATTEDVVVHHAVDKVHHRRKLAVADSLRRGGLVLGQSAAAIDIVEIQVTTVVDTVMVCIEKPFFDIDLNLSFDIAIVIASTEDTAYLSAIDVDGDIAVDIGSFVVATARTAKHISEIAAVDGKVHAAMNLGITAAAIQVGKFIVVVTPNVSVDISDNFCIVGSAEEIVDLKVTANRIVFFDMDVDTSAIGIHRTLHIAAAKIESDIATENLGVGATQADIGWLHLAITATENEVVTSSVDNGAGTYRMGCVAATIDVLNGIFAPIDMNLGPFRRS